MRERLWWSLAAQQDETTTPAYSACSNQHSHFFHPDNISAQSLPITYEKTLTNFIVLKMNPNRGNKEDVYHYLL